MSFFASLQQLRSARVLVVGDFMLDVYTNGSVERISPEAPVPVVKVHGERVLPGGAGNVALNLLSLGMEVSVCGRVGDDASGVALRAHFEEEGIDMQLLCTDPTCSTPRKTRVIADGQQLVRLDEEIPSTLSEASMHTMMAALKPRIASFDIIAISDYAKGTVPRALCLWLIDEARRAGVAVVVDPKDCDFSKYAGASLIKPNLKEAKLAANLGPGASLPSVAEALLSASSAEYLMITRSEDGIALFSDKQQPLYCKAQSKDVVDVTGAGDTVLACMTLAMASGIPMMHALEIANCAASISVRRLGCYRVTLAEICERFVLQQQTKLLCDEQALFVDQSLDQKPYTLIVLGSGSALPMAFFSEIIAHKERYPERNIVVYCPAKDMEERCLRLLSSFKAIDSIVEQRGDITPLLERLTPQATLTWHEDTLVEHSFA